MERSEPQGGEETSALYSGKAAWLDAAMKLDGEGNFQKIPTTVCARKMDDALKHLETEEAGGITKEMRHNLIRQTFEKVYLNMGSEIPPEQLKNAIVIKTNKFHPVTVVFLQIITLGLFTVFRPQDDETILVLTEGGRVYLLKVERPNAFGIDLQVALMTFLRLLLVMILIVTAPSFVVMAFGYSGMDTGGFDIKGEGNFIQTELELDQKVYGKAARNSAVLMGVGGSLLIGAACWLYTHWPADYATRSRQSFKAETVSSIQYTISGAKVARKLIMRLYFGKYPGQAALDGVGLTIGCSAGPVPTSELCDPAAAALGSGGKNSKAQKVQEAQSTNFSPLFVTILTVTLFLVTTLDACFTWFDRVVQISHMATVREFCVEAPSGIEEGKAYCTVSKCTEWAKSIDYDADFCAGVQYYETKTVPKTKDNETDYTSEEMVTNSEVMAICLQYGHSEGTCCGGCLLSVKDIFGGGWYEVMKTILEVVGDVGALLFSFVAAKYAMTVSSASEHLEIVCQRAPTCCGCFTPDTLSDFTSSEPLALKFLEELFIEAWDNEAEDQQVVADPSLNIDGEDEDRGVKAYALENQMPTWEEFLAEKSIVEMDFAKMLLKVNVPVKALGLADTANNKEQVVAAWSEMERMRFSDLGPSVLYGLIVLGLALLFAPTYTIEVGDHTLVGASKVIEAVAAGLLFAILHLMFRFFVEFKNSMHAVVVTDMRLFYIRQKFRLPGTSLLGVDLRVDAFRHDRDLFYGRCTNVILPWYQRCMGYKFMPGMVYMQCKKGVLKLTRQSGNAMDVFHVVSMLARKSMNISMEKLQQAGIDQHTLMLCKNSVEKGLFKKKDAEDKEIKGVWDIHPQETDVVRRSPDIYLCHEDEAPLYHWSGTEAGVLASPYNSTTDVIVTTDRVFLWQRPLLKSFDCKTCLCWGACWCGCLSKFIEAGQLPNTMSFLCYKVMLSFSTESQIDPPLLTNPAHPPVNCPCVDECCACCTRCVTCESFCEVMWDKCSVVPRRPNPRSQLYLMWRSRYGGQQPDLTTVLRPYMDEVANMESREDDTGLVSRVMNLLEDAQIVSRSEDPEQEQMLSRETKVQIKEVEVLRKLMAVVQSDLEQRAVPQ